MADLVVPTTSFSGIAPNGKAFAHYPNDEPFEQPDWANWLDEGIVEPYKPKRTRRKAAEEADGE